jgi:disulfide bond formation protein DsbB
MTALGKLAPELREMVREGASFDDIMSEMAITMGGAASEAANTAEGRFKRLGVAFDETKESIGAALIPVIEAVLPLVEKFAKWAQDNPTAFMIIAGAIGAIALSIMAINFAMALNPFTAIAMGVIALIALIIGAYKRFESFRNIVDAVFGAIKWWVTNVTIPIVESLLGVFKTVFNGIGKIWNNTVGKISFEVPGWVPGLGGKGFDMPKIPMLADGGIVTSPTLALIGEGRGPEAVIPLNRMNEFTGGGGGEVNIYVQGADPNAVVDALRTYMFRNGTVPIKVA